MTDTTPQPEKRSVPWHWSVLGLLVVAQAGLGAYLSPTFSSGSGALGMGATLGVLLSQPLLLAFWAGFASQRFFQRFLWTYVLCILVALAEEVTPLCTQGRADLRIFTAFVALFATGTLVFLNIRQVSGWQIKHPIIEDARSDYRPSQFGIKHLITLISITALACGLARSLVVFQSVNSPRLPSVLKFLMAVYLILWTLLPVLVIPWFAMVNRPRITLPICKLATIWAMCSGAVCFSFAVATGTPLVMIVNEEFIEFTVFVQLSAGLSVLVTSLVMRFCGFRMIRVPRAA